MPAGIVSPVDVLRRRNAAESIEEDQPASSSSSEPLLEQPLTVNALELPFRETSAKTLVSDFYNLLKTKIIGRFLGSRRASIRPG